ncbi:putative F-box/kelch-repeat protein At3g17280 [Triticum aestivum]|uniref:putative F-box/kelch-repeat protein At3g17280 n=1 Tax=Triticum aestivum TaxID=4565 RepID=UPI001D03577A|nr:putative F-box/kelch-repeat protein At3g17280 [Triticum aestivum]
MTARREMTASSPCRRARSPAEAPLDDEDLLAEILLRLSPRPSSLPRAFLVCTRWRGLVSDPRFLRRFRLRHGRRSPPLLGFIVRERNTVRLRPVGDPPDRVPAERFSSLLLGGAEWAFRLLDCRHGLVLISDTSRNMVLVWDPATGGQHWVAVQGENPHQLGGASRRRRNPPLPAGPCRQQREENYAGARLRLLVGDRRMG